MDPRVAELDRFINCGNQDRARTCSERGACHLHRAQSVRISLEHHIKVSTCWEMRLQTAHVLFDRIKVHFDPRRTPEGREAGGNDRFWDPHATPRVPPAAHRQRQRRIHAHE